MEPILISKKLESIENDVYNLKVIFSLKSKKSIISLKGMLKGIKIIEKDINKAKKSLFSSF